MRISLFKANGGEELCQKLADSLNLWQDIFPEDLDKLILIKPNLNSSLDALTGNTTDLRILSSLIKYLKDKGYKRIVIGEGYNSGFHRENIDVIKRNRVDKLAEYYNINVVDFNFSEGKEIELENGIKTQIAKLCLEADLFINVPKLKMHFMTQMSVCLKSLIGALVGRRNKLLVHRNLSKNILRLNDVIKPNLFIVDGLIGMEGTGPSAGSPIKMDTVIIGDNPYLIDLVCARLVGCEYHELPVIKEAMDSGRITKEIIDTANSVDIQKYYTYFKKPSPNFMANLIIHPRYQKYFVAFRNLPLISPLLSNIHIRKILLSLGITQELVMHKERNNSIFLHDKLCDQCKQCRPFCPIFLKLPEDFHNAEKMEHCIDCLYCFAICPKQAIQVDGNLGYYKEQLSRYDKLIRGRL